MYGAEIIKVVVGRRQSRKNFFTSFGNPPSGALGPRCKMNPEMVGNDGLQLGLGRSGEEQQRHDGDDRSAQSASLSQIDDQHQAIPERQPSFIHQKILGCHFPVKQLNRPGTDR